MRSLATSCITRYNRPRHTRRASASRTPKSAGFSLRAARFTSNARKPGAKATDTLSSLNLKRVPTFASWRWTSIVQEPLHDLRLRDVEYALRGVASPIGVANWEKVLVEKLPKEFEGVLPTVEQLEAELMPKKRSKR